MTFALDADNIMTVVQYGRLEKVLDFQTGNQNIWRELKATHHLLAVITPCKTDGKDTSHELVEYEETREAVITDVRNIKAVVGRVKRGTKWIIVDRSVDSAHVTPQVMEDENNKDSD